MSEKSIVKLTLDKGDQLYLKSLFPIEWTEFISEANCYDSFEDAKKKLNEQYYRLSVNLHEIGVLMERISINTYIDGKFSSTMKYIGG